MSMDKINKIYDWAAHNVTELHEAEDYLETREIKILKRRLRRTRGQLIAVIGLQGVGKTALRQHLAKQTKRNQSLLWTNQKKVVKLLSSIHHIQADKDSLLEMGYGSLAEDLIKGEVTKNDARRGLVKDAIEDNIDILLVDFPDYDKRSKSRALRDLRDFREFWDWLAYDEGRYNRSSSTPNIVLFWQEELWGADHFLKGKFDVFRIRPFTPEEIADYYEKKWDGPDPFTREALLSIADLARGIFRWYKKYIQVCLDQRDYEEEDSCNTGEGRISGQPIGVEDVQKWITMKQLLEDWNRELMTLFPKSRKNRKNAVILLRFLREKGPTTQKQIAETHFPPGDAGAVACSRVLTKLEEFDYITRSYEGRDKIVELVTGR